MKKIIYILLLTIPLSLAAQSVKELEKQRNKTLKQLETTTKMLNETKRDETSTANKVEILDKSIRERQKLIHNINTELNALDKEMDFLNIRRDSLSEILKKVKADYASLVVKAHETQRNNNALRFLLTSNDFNQLMRRTRYLQEFSNYRKEQAAKIMMLTDSINSQNEMLQQDKEQKEEVMKLQEREKAKLAQDQQKHKQMLNQLKKKEKDLIAQQKAQQKKANELNNKITKLIEEEIRKSEAKKKKEGKTVAMTKEEKLLAGGFEANKGRLPWPTEKGFVSGYYGVQQHPLLSHVTIDNKGIYIQTTKGADARAVYDGVVTQCFTVPGSNNIVIVQHGNYRTVYANLTTLYVHAGDKVKAKQNIGKIYTDPDNDNKTEIQFQVYKDKTRVNPLPWLSK